MADVLDDVQRRPDVTLEEGARRVRASRILADSPLLPAALAGTVALLFVVVRLAEAAHGDVSRFIMAGLPFSDPRFVPHGIYVGAHGYDGQFFYRMALNPTNFHGTAFGIRLDYALRLQRIGYPALVWLVSLGNRSLVPTCLVGVNVACIAGLGWFGGIVARDSRRHALWGLVLPGYFGFVTSLSRDLSEILIAFFAVAGMITLRRSSPIMAGAAFSAAVLTKETALVFVGGYAIVRIVEISRRRAHFGRADVAWVLPGAVFVCWQVIVGIAVGTVPFFSDSRENACSLPFVSMLAGVRHFFDMLPSTTAMNWLGQFCVLAFIVGAAALTWTKTESPPYQRVAWLLAVAMVVTLSGGVWERAFDEFRTFGEVYVLSWMILLNSTRRLHIPAVLAAGSWLVLAAHHVVTL